MNKNNRSWKKEYLVLLSFFLFTSSLLANLVNPVIHQYASQEGGIFSNAYLIELEKGVVIIDATLTNSSAKELEDRLNKTGKPLLAILLTHGHPDHYNGITKLLGGKPVPVYATSAVAEVIKKYDDIKEQQWKPVFKDEWPTNRTFPTNLLKDSESITFEGVKFTVHNLGAGESHSDSYWTFKTRDQKYAFIGDVVLNKVHAYFSDGHSYSWLANIEKLKKDLKGYNAIYPGHGQAGGLEILDWQKAYIETYQKHVKELMGADGKLSDDSKSELARRMQDFLPNQKLIFLVGLGADPVGQEILKRQSGK